MTALFSTAYFPPIAYMSAMLRCNAAMIEAKETFPKQTYRNRMEIMTAEGVRTLSVPTIRSNHSRTDEVGIDYKERWDIIHLRTIEAAYAASPYYEYYRDDLKALLTAHHVRLMDLNAAILEWLLTRLKKPLDMTPTTDFRPIGDNDENDYRYRFTPKKPLEKTSFAPYYQVFGDRQPFAPNLSILDLLMNLGPEAREYLTTKVS